MTPRALPTACRACSLPTSRASRWSTRKGCDYVDPDARLANATIYNWIHPLGDVVTSLIASGMTLDWLHEHDAVPWHMFRIL